ncbi:hypothetical protein BC360_07910 [Ensifer sp. LC163]|nr:hypothetical protein BC360_07910 [Ensifer sp. LC163]
MKGLAMLSALRSTIRHVLSAARRAADATTTIDTFSEFQLRDIGLTRDNEGIRVRAGDIAVPWQRAPASDPGNAPSSRGPDHDVAPHPAASSLAGLREKQNTDISTSLCD